MNNNNQINKVTVAIFNEDYVVKGEEEPEYIYRCWLHMWTGACA